MKKVFLFFLAISLIIAAGFFLKNGQPAKPIDNLSNQPTAPVYLNQKIKSISPRPSQIIKGTLFKISGAVETEETAAVIRLFDKNNLELQYRRADLILNGEALKNFDQEFDLANYDGALRIKIFLSEENIADFSIRIIKSL